MKLKAFTLFLLLFTVLCAQAATPEEMERARVAAFKVCLRHLNNRSDYLEEKNPKNMAELESQLKDTEKTNIEVLKKIKIPEQSEYAGWDKKKFDDFWINTFVDATAVEGKDWCRNSPKNGMNLAFKDLTSTVQSSAATDTQETTEPAEEPSAEVVPDDKADENEIEVGDLEVVDTEQIQTEPVSDKQQAKQEKSSNNTIEIVVLCILVVVVIALVGYALNIMKKNRMKQAASVRSSQRKPRQYDVDDYKPARTVEADPEDESPFAAYSAPQQPDIDPRDREIERLRSEIASLQTKIKGTPAARPAMGTPVRRNEPRIIYLAKANNEGVFTRADARYNMGNSIFKLVTTDGVSGSFSVLEDPTVFELALMMPTEYLVNACIGRNLQLSEGARTIVNIASGTAIFEDGRWRVSRKAQIRYSV